MALAFCTYPVGKRFNPFFIFLLPLPEKKERIIKKSTVNINNSQHRKTVLAVVEKYSFIGV